MRNRAGVAEQSHKREMNDAVRGDFERLRARRQRRDRTDKAPPVPSPTRVVLTPPPLPEALPESAAERTESPADEAPAAPARSWLRSILRRL